MPAFKKKIYTDPIIGSHNNDIAKDWYVFFRFKHERKVFKLKRREGINRIKDLKKKLRAIKELQSEIEYDLRHGWNPILDKKRELVYYSPTAKRISSSKKMTRQELFNKFYYK